MAKKFLIPIDLSQLEIQNVRMQNLATAPASPVLGQFYYNTTTNKAMVWDGTNWIPWELSASIPDMTGATASANGTHGLVPAPSAGEQNDVLFGDATWGELGVGVSTTTTNATVAITKDGTNLNTATVPAAAAGNAGLMSASDKAKLDGFHGGNAWYATCPTAAATAAKVVTTQTGDFVLATGSIVYVKFTNAGTYNGTSTLNVDGTGAKNIVTLGTTVTSRYYWNAGELVGFVYDGTNFTMIEGGVATTTYYGVTKLSAATNSTSTALAATASAVKAAYDRGDAAYTLADGKSVVSATQTLTSGTEVGKVTVDGTATTFYAPTPPTKTSDLTNDSDFVSDASYVHTDNNFTTTLKNKLDGIASGAEVNVQANWNETSTTSDAYIQNKPTLGTAAAKGVDTSIASGSTSTSLPTTAAVVNYISQEIGAADAMRFKGTIGTGGTVTSLPSTHQIGDTYRVITAGTYAGQTCEVGDLIIALTTSGTTASDWTVAQTNIDGAITSLSSGTGISVTGSGSSRTIGLASGVATAGSVGDTSNQTPTFGGTFKAISQTIDAYGRTTATAEHTVTIPTLPTASTSASGIVQLNNTVTSTSTSQAATANAVKTAYDRADAAYALANTPDTTQTTATIAAGSTSVTAHAPNTTGGLVYNHAAYTALIGTDEIILDASIDTTNNTATYSIASAITSAITVITTWSLN